MLKGLRPELSELLSGWMRSYGLDDSTASRNPMLTPEYLKLMKARTDESEKMTAKASEAFDGGNKPNLVSDTYSFLSVMFGTVIFLSAITTKLVRARARLLLLVISALICAVVLFFTIFSMPIAYRG